MTPHATAPMTATADQITMLRVRDCVLTGSPPRMGSSTPAGPRAPARANRVV